MYSLGESDCRHVHQLLVSADVDVTNNRLCLRAVDINHVTPRWMEGVTEESVYNPSYFIHVFCIFPFDRENPHPTHLPMLNNGRMSDVKTSAKPATLIGLYPMVKWLKYTHRNVTFRRTVAMLYLRDSARFGCLLGEIGA